MRRIFSFGAALLLALFAHAANAGPVLVIQAIGNLADSEPGWHPNHPDMSPEEYARLAFTHTLMLDLDSCTLSHQDGLSGKCTLFRDVVKSTRFDFDSGWVTPLGEANNFISFNINKTEFSAENLYLWYQTKPKPADYPYEVWGRSLNIYLEGVWDAQINDLSEVFDRKLRVKQMDQGLYNPNASIDGNNYEPGPDDWMILETGSEFFKIYFIPEPSSLALMGLAMTGLAFARRRKA